MKRLWLILLPLLGGCQWMGRQADALGSHMPVIGDRCENWQCFTSSGQAQSDMIKRQKEMEKQQQPLVPPPVNGETPAPPPAPVTTAPPI